MSCAGDDRKVRGFSVVISRLLVPRADRRISMSEGLDVFWHILDIAIKKKNLTFEIDRIGWTFAFHLHISNAHNSINEKGNPRHYLAEPQTFHTRRLLFA
jgi:hypothetical protein